MRLLVLSLTFPFPASNGHKMRTWALLRALSAEQHEITVLTFADPDELKANYGPLLEVSTDLEIVPLRLVGLSSGSDYLGRVRTLLGSLPHAVTRFSSSEMEQRVAGRLEGGKYDALLAETPYVLINVPRSLTVPLIVDNHNIEHLLLERYLSIEQNPARRIYASIESRKMKAWEQRAWTRSALSLVCSENDRQVVQEISPGTACAVVPNVVDAESYEVSHGCDSSTVLYTGGMDWYPNRDAVAFFVTQILPRLRLQHPRVKFVVAGRSPSAEFRRRFEGIPGIVFTGTVPDMRKEIARATVCVVPLRVGSGTRLKILEAAGMGKAVVATRVGAEGLDFVDGREIVLADEPAAFANAVSDLLAHEARRQTLGMAARRKLEEHYSFACLCKSVRESLDSLIPTRASLRPDRRIEMAMERVGQ
ncbi:MAG: glycosyltransferase family 4 protein [Terriglobia bacterium]